MNKFAGGGEDTTRYTHGSEVHSGRDALRDLAGEIPARQQFNVQGVAK